jgi:hypothetical protein
MTKEQRFANMKDMAAAFASVVPRPQIAASDSAQYLMSDIASIPGSPPPPTFPDSDIPIEPQRKSRMAWVIGITALALLGAAGSALLGASDDAIQATAEPSATPSTTAAPAASAVATASASAAPDLDEPPEPDDSATPVASAPAPVTATSPRPGGWGRAPVAKPPAATATATAPAEPRSPRNRPLGF